MVEGNGSKSTRLQLPDCSKRGGPVLTGRLTDREKGRRADHAVGRSMLAAFAQERHGHKL